MRCLYLVWVLFIIWTGPVLLVSDARTPDVAPHGPGTPSLPAVHHLQSMDCRNPTHQRTTLLKDACAPPTTRRKEYVETKDVAIVQRVKSFQRKATRCRKYISTITEVCGKWGHSKLLFPPRILESKEITEKECQLISNSKLYRDERGHTHAIDSQDFVYHLVLHGNLAYSMNDVRCTGANRVDVGGRIMDDVLTLATFKLEIRPLTVTQTPTQVIDNESGYLLPLSCATQDTCRSENTAYVFQGVPRTCPFHKIEIMNLDIYLIRSDDEVKKWAVSDKHHIIFVMEDARPATASCDGVFSQYIPTQFQELALIEDDHLLQVDALPQLGGDLVDLSLELRMTETYEREHLESRLRNLTSEIAGELCTLARGSWQGEMLSPFHPHALLRVRGEILQELVCRPVPVILREGDSLEDACWQDALPVLRGGEHLLLEANTRILVEPSNVRRTPCDTLNLPIFHIGGKFLIADPVVRVVAVNLRKINIFDSDLEENHFDSVNAFTEPLLYTRGELQAFRDLIAHKAARKAVTHSFAREYCGRSGACGDYVPPSGYMSFDKLLSSVDPTSWFETLRGYLQEAGQICSVLVIALLCCNVVRLIANFVSFKCAHGYATRDAWMLTVKPGELLTRYAADLHAQDRERDPVTN